MFAIIDKLNEPSACCSSPVDKSVSNTARKLGDDFAVCHVDAVSMSEGSGASISEMENRGGMLSNAEICMS